MPRLSPGMRRRQCPETLNARSAPLIYPVIGWRSIPASLWCLNTPSGVQDMPPFRKFHSIAALCGDGLRPELQALFERLAVDPHHELFVRDDGMVQSGPDPVSAKAPLAQATGETSTSEADSAPADLQKNFQSAD